MIDIKKNYFIASYRYNKEKPEDFNLLKVEGKEYCLDKNGIKWKESYLWCNGWGQEYGFIRQPEPSFNELWSLLKESKIENNQLGAAELINLKYPEELKNKLLKYFKSEQSISKDLSKRFDLLELGINRSETIGKHYKEIEKDFKQWNFLKTEYERLKITTMSTKKTFLSRLR